jgi:hypothetical protein
MRGDSQRLISAVDTLPDGDIQHAAALGRAFAAIAGLIHDHHWTSRPRPEATICSRHADRVRPALNWGRAEGKARRRTPTVHHRRTMA